ncbi:MAG: hypothetical protein PVH87_28800 [Desulfobacteraceae bacterium]|jgi:hypothetical protein
MFKLLKGTSAPSIFAKGLNQYKQGNFSNAKQLISTAGTWMPDLENDDLFNAVSLLIEVKTGSDVDIFRCQEALASLNAAPCKDSGDFPIIRGDLEKVITEDEP